MGHGRVRCGGVWQGTGNSRLSISNSASSSVNGKAGYGLVRRAVVRFGVVRHGTGNSQLGIHRVPL